MGLVCLASCYPIFSALGQGALCPPPQGIVAWWPGDLDGRDISGAHLGTLSGDATVGSGHVGQGFHFGGNGAVDVADSPSLNFGISDFSVEFWIQFSNLQHGANGVLSKDSFTGDVSSATGWLINICSDCGDGGHGVGGGGFGFETRRLIGNTGPHTHARWDTSNLSTGVWYHVVAVRGSSILKLYIDGVLRASTPEPAPTDVNTPAGLTIGTLNPIHTQSFNGLLDEVTLFGRALSGGEVAEIFAAGASGKCKVNSPPPDPKNLVINGSFGAGKNGFTSDYTYSSDNLGPEIIYSVKTNPTSVNGNFYPATDHTSGTGEMLVVNGATSEGAVVWRQTVTVEPGTTYRFSVWAANLTAENPPNLVLRVNGVALGAPQPLSSMPL